MAGNLKKGGGAAAALIALLVVFVGHNEGVRLNTYRDAGGVPTTCFGETRGVKMGDHHTLDECKAMFAKALAEFGKHIEACITQPMSVETEAAFISVGYNAGWQGFCLSPAAHLYNAGRFREACLAISGWHVSQRGVGVLPGLQRRRNEERDLCLKGLH